MSPKKNSKGFIEAAGAVILKGEKRNLRIAVIHRPHRSDWSFPKGKIDFPETKAAAAVREVFEETGLRITLHQPLPEQNYVFDGADKTVYYWRARLISDDPFVPNDEADELVWLSPTQAIEKLTYDVDKDLVKHVLNSEDSSPLILMRHAEAEKRADWSNRYQGNPPSDNFRPLTQTGLTQSILISETLNAFGITKIISSDSTRCISTVTPFAASIEAPVEAHQTLSELGWSTNNLPGLRIVFEAATDPESLVICAHRPSLPLLAEEIAQAFDIKHIDGSLQPGSLIIIHRNLKRNSVIAVERIIVDSDF